MPTSQNGWPASPNLDTVPLVVDGVAFVGGVRPGDVHTVLGYVVTQFHQRVEKLVNPGCWGFAFRDNRNDPNSLSNHSSATAVDANAPKHPNGVPTSRTFTSAQIAEVHQILAEVDGVVRWGGDFQITPDAMHFEINDTPDAVARVAARLEDPMLDPAVKAQLDSIERKVTNLADREKARADRAKARDQRILDELDAIADDQNADTDTIKARIRSVRQKLAALDTDTTEEN